MGHPWLRPYVRHLWRVKHSVNIDFRRVAAVLCHLWHRHEDRKITGLQVAVGVARAQVSHARHTHERQKWRMFLP